MLVAFVGRITIDALGFIADRGLDAEDQVRGLNTRAFYVSRMAFYGSRMARW